MRRALAVLTLLLFGPFAIAANDPLQHRFDIASQPLESALHQLADQAGVSVLFEPSQVAGKSGHAVKGQYTTREALSRLLVGSGLNSAVRDDGSVTVSLANGAADAVTTFPKITVSDALTSANGTRGYVATNAVTATKTDTPLMETPVTVQVIQQQLLRDLGTTTGGFTQALTYLGIPNQGCDQCAANIFLRGFSTGATLWNGFRIDEINNNSSVNNGGVFMNNVEKIEVIRGPASVLYGRVEPGGMVNVITRKPQEEAQVQLGAGGGSWSDRWLSADLTGPFDAAKTLLYRINVSDESANSWYRGGADYRSVAIAPALEWRIDSRTSVSLEGQFRTEHGEAGSGAVLIDPATGQLVPVPRENAVLPANYAYFRQQRLLLDAEHGFGANWTMSWKVMHHDSKVPDAKFDYLEFSYFPPAAPNVLMIDRFIGTSNREIRTDATTLDFTGHFDALGVKHTLLIGGDYYDKRYWKNNTWSCCVPTNFFNPSTPSPADYGNPTSSFDPNINTGDGTGYAYADDPAGRSRDYSIYVQDQLDLPRDLHVLLGARYQHSRETSTYNGAPNDPIGFDTVTPRVGLLWRPRAWASIYYSYSENIGASNGFAYPGKPIQPETSRQHELGVKSEWFAGRLTATLSLFDLLKQHIAAEDPGHPVFNIPVGKVRSRGYEFNVQGELAQDWNVVLNIDYARPLVIVGASGATSASPETIVAGQLLPDVPNHTYALWTSYRLPIKTKYGVRIGGGIIGASQLNPEDGATVTGPSYWISSAFAAWDMDLVGRRATLQLNVNNVFDKAYVNYLSNSGVSWGTPRQILLGLKVEL